MTEGSVLKKKKIMLCVTGSIAAYKAAGICSALVKLGAEVFPVLSPNALNFINPLTFSAISGKKAVSEEFINEERVLHVSLAHTVDVILVAPATANTVSKLACGICDNFLTTSVISSECPVLIAPAMNQSMFLNSAVVKNIEALEKTGRYFFAGPSEGRLACGEEGAGRLADQEDIIKKLEELVLLKNDLNGKKVLITAGGTREFIDSVRFISNLSSGKMGYELSCEAFFRGAEKVVLVSANKSIQKPFGVTVCYAESTEDMMSGINRYFEDSDVIIMAAAISDIVPRQKYDYKLKKNDDIISKLNFKENINILRLLSEKKKQSQYLVGFSAEFGELVENAKAKIRDTNIDMIVLNDISRKDTGFGSDFNEVFIITGKSPAEKIEKNSKRIIARRIWDNIIKNSVKFRNDL